MKTAEQVLNTYHHSAHAKEVIIKAMEEYASQFKASEPIEKEQEILLPLNFVKSITGWAKDDLQRKYEKWKATRKQD